MLPKQAKYREIKISMLSVALIALYLGNYNFDPLQIFSTYAPRLALQLSFFDLHALIGPKQVKKWLKTGYGDSQNMKQVLIVTGFLGPAPPTGAQKAGTQIGRQQQVNYGDSQNMKQVNNGTSPLRGARAQYPASQGREQRRHEASQPSCQSASRRPRPMPCFAGSGTDKA